MDLARLRQAILDDTLGVGLNTIAGSGNDVALAAELNTVRRGFACPRLVITAADLIACLDPDELAGLSRNQRAQLDLLLARPEAITLTAAMETALENLFGENSKTLNSIALVDGSIAMSVGFDQVTPEQVGLALAGDRKAVYDAAQKALSDLADEIIAEKPPIDETDERKLRELLVERRRAALERADEELNGADWKRGER